jgi:hypothetical protein
VQPGDAPLKDPLEMRQLLETSRPAVETKAVSTTPRLSAISADPAKEPAAALFDARNAHSAKDPEPPPIYM